MINITERRARDVTILDLEGNLIMGGGSALLRDTIRRLIEAGEKKILLNFAGVKYIDSSGIGEMVSASVALRRDGGHLKLMNIPPKVDEVLALSSVLSIFEVYDNESEALKKYASTA
jgi:anti-sigma B factor antagonist